MTRASSQSQQLNETFYSSSYEEAKSRFIESATAANATLSSYLLQCYDAAAVELTIDVATVGPEGAPTLVVSSGLHGVEGFLGSAIQLAMLEELRTNSATNIRWVFIHAINPVGFANVRRFNEDNVDLNRNFLLDDSEYVGAPENYDRLNVLLNPATPPSRFELFRIKALWQIIRHGMGALKQCIASGQYEYPCGIFYGGAKPSQAMEVIRKNCKHWVGSAQQVLHVDFHSGLGAYGEYKLMRAEPVASEQCQWYQGVFGRDSIENNDDAAYRATGTFGQWLHHQFVNRNYRFVTSEFGTYGPVRVLAAIRAENRAHHFVSVQSQAYQAAKLELMECFCPADVSWRRRAVTSGLNILQQGADGLNLRRQRRLY